MTNDRSINQDDFSAEVLNFADIKQCWKNILYTIPGTYPLLPTFGCDIWQHLDTPQSDSSGKARNVIIGALEKWEPRAKITNVKRITEGSKNYISIMGRYIETGELISSNIDSVEENTPDNTSEKQIIYIGSVASLNPSEGLIKTLFEAISGKANQSFIYTIDTARFCIAYPAIWGDLASIEDPSGYEIISGFERTNLNITIADKVYNYTIYTLSRATSQSNFTVKYLFS